MQADDRPPAGFATYQVKRTITMKLEPISKRPDVTMDDLERYLMVIAEYLCEIEDEHDDLWYCEDGTYWIHDEPLWTNPLVHVRFATGKAITDVEDIS